MKPPRVLVTIATYNERENLESLVTAILANLPSADVLVIDDNSPDGTGELADQMSNGNAQLQVVHRTGKLGLGSAILHAMRFAAEHDYDYFVNMDADFSHSPSYLPALVAGMENHDLMIGSRYIPGGGVVGWTWTRKLMSWGINAYSHSLLRLTARDTSGGFRCFRVAKLRTINLDRIYCHGYAFHEELLYHCQRAGFRVGETPIVFKNRRSGRSKISIREIVKALWGLLVVATRG